MKKLLIASITALMCAMPAFAADAPKASTIEMEVDGLVCAFCAQGISKKLKKEDATKEVFVNLERKLVAVALKPGKDIADDALKALLLDAGYTLVGIKRTDTPLDTFRKEAEAQ